MLLPHAAVRQIKRKLKPIFFPSGVFPLHLSICHARILGKSFWPSCVRFTFANLPHKTKGCRKIFHGKTETDPPIPLYPPLILVWCPRVGYFNLLMICLKRHSAIGTGDFSFRCKEAHHEQGCPEATAHTDSLSRFLKPFVGIVTYPIPCMMPHSAGFCSSPRFLA